MIALLFQEEDRVTLEHIQELAARPDAAAPLREILTNETYWEEGEEGEWWIMMHAVTILALQKDLANLDSILQAAFYSWEEMHDWVNEILSAALAQFGEGAVPRLMEYILQAQGKFTEDEHWGYARNNAAEALTMIALAHPATRDTVLEFLCERFTDPAERDELFLSFSIPYPIKLDTDRGLAAVRSAYNRDLIDEMVMGSYEDVRRDAELGQDFGQYWSRDWLEFYRPEEIQRRQNRWQNERDAEAKRLAAGPGAYPDNPYGSLLRGWDSGDGDSGSRDSSRFGAPLEVPTGYTQSARGNLVNTVSVGRNDPCPCGSGKKHKKCCGK